MKSTSSAASEDEETKEDQADLAKFTEVDDMVRKPEPSPEYIDAVKKRRLSGYFQIEAPVKKVRKVSV